MNAIELFKGWSDARKARDGGSNMNEVSRYSEFFNIMTRGAG